MGKISRRVFVGRGAAGAMALAIMGSAPAGTILAEGDASTLEGEDLALSPEAISTGIVAHIRDISAGELSIMSGAREVIVRDPQLVARLIRAAR